MKNELSSETSPYLLQHAHNPVHWQPWGEKALQLAKDLDKPILISIGYSACHWCHVMEKESFENEATAAIMNTHFINIKIDREERPDLDHIYMDAVQAMTGAGGWPLNVFLTPNAKPFYGGTYFPPVKAHGRASWSDVLTSINNAWLHKRNDMELQAETLVTHLKKANNFNLAKNNIQIDTGAILFSKSDCEIITKNLLAVADNIDGGFSNAPKFPQTFSINCLLQLAYFLEDKNALQQAELSLTKMLHGGIYDQLAGGLCRYSTDKEWLAPHFEKMLYDNALLIITLCNAYLLTKNEMYKNRVEHICNFIFEEMKNKGGGYYAAIDADSEGVEGKFYVWSKAEIDLILKDNAPIFNTYYDVTENGNWEQKNILRIIKPLQDVATQYNVTINEATLLLNNATQLLLKQRNKRIRPTTDDKILLSWNALLLTAFCKAYEIIQNDKYKQAAEDLFQFIENKFTSNGEAYFHTFKNGNAKHPAFLEDYAYFIEACISLQEITSNENYLHKAKKLANFTINNFSDDNNKYFFFTKTDQSDIIVRKIEIYDGATPSANAVMAKNLYYLSVIFNEQAWKNRAVFMLESLKTIIIKQPNSFGVWAALSINIAAGINEITIIGNDMTLLLKKMLLQYLPNKILQTSNEASSMPLLSQKEVNDKAKIYLCKNFVCSKPIDNVEDMFINMNHFVL